jgi:O-antigen ligase
LGAAVFWLIPAPLIDLNAAMFTILAENGSTTRQELWQVAWGQFRASPLVGGGPGSVAAAYSKSLLFDRFSHNYALNSLADFGVAGTIPFLAMLWIVCYRSAKVAGKSNVGLALFIGIVATLAHGLVEPTFPGQEYEAVFWILAAAVQTLYQAPNSSTFAGSPLSANAVPSQEAHSS